MDLPCDIMALFSLDVVELVLACDNLGMPPIVTLIIQQLVCHA